MDEDRTITVNGELVRAAHVRLWLRKFPWVAYLFPLVFVGLVVGLVFANESPLWLRVETTVGLALYILWPAISYYYAVQRVGSWTPGLVFKPTTYHFKDEYFGIEVDFGRVEIRWNHLADIIKYDDVWVLQFNRKSLTCTLSPDVVNHPGVKEILNAKLAEVRT